MRPAVGVVHPEMRIARRHSLDRCDAQLACESMPCRFRRKKEAIKPGLADVCLDRLLRVRTGIAKADYTPPLRSPSRGVIEILAEFCRRKFG